METKKRKAYKTTEQQKAATKRYFENNPEAKEKKKIATYKSRGRIFIKEYSNLDDLEEYKKLISEREKELK